MKKIKNYYNFDFNGSFAFYLLNSGKTLLIDTGTLGSVKFLRNFLESSLQDKQLDYVFLTHSHYDHCGGIPFLIEKYPSLKIIASKRTKEIFSKEKAVSFIEEMNKKTGNSQEFYTLNYKTLRVDMVVSDGDEIEISGHRFRIYETPGHTKCSISIYDTENKILFPGDSLGIVEKNGNIKPLFFSSYKAYINSIKKIKSIKDISIIAFPHNNPFEGKKAYNFLQIVEEETEMIKDYILKFLKEGKDEDFIVKTYLNNRFLKENAIEQPEETFLINLYSMVRAVKKDFFS